MIIYVIVNYTQSIDAWIYIHIHDKMKTPEQATKMHEQKFESKRAEFDKIIDNAIENNFDISKWIVEVQDQAAIRLYNIFTQEIVKHCKNSWWDLKVWKYTKYSPNDRDWSWEENMLILKPASKTITYSGVDYHRDQWCTCDHKYKTWDSWDNFKVWDMK